MQRLTAHLRDVGETYTEHMACAGAFAGALLVTALACAVHAVFPFWFVHTASRRVSRLEKKMRERVAARPARQTDDLVVASAGAGQQPDAAPHG